MKVSSGPNGVYQLLQPQPKPTSGGDVQQSTPRGQAVGGPVSGSFAAASLQARLAQSSFERNDLNHDGFVEESEFVKNNLKPRHDGYQPTLGDVQKHWNAIDKDGTGKLDRDAYVDGFSSVLTVSVGRFSKPIR